jgi:hypothetical protein
MQILQSIYLYIYEKLSLKAMNCLKFEYFYNCFIIILNFETEMILKLTFI